MARSRKSAALKKQVAVKLSPPRIPAPTRAVYQPTLASRPTCLRCLKRWIDPTHFEESCVQNENRKCDYCASQHKPCVEVPTKFRACAEDLLVLQDEASGLAMLVELGNADDEDQARLETVVRQLVDGAKAFKRDVENWKRRQARRGGLTHAPRNLEEIVRSVVPVIEDIRDSMAELVKVQTKLLADT